MNAEQFLYAVRATGRKFRVRKDGSIRDGGYCPLTAVCRDMTGVHFQVGAFRDAAELIGMDYQDAKTVVEAADEPAKTNEYHRRLARAAGVNLNQKAQRIASMAD